MRRSHDDPAVQEAVSVIRGAAEAAGVVPGIVCPNGTIARRYVLAGFRMVDAVVDLSLLLDGAEAELRIAQGG